MFWILARKELLANLLTLRLGIILLFSVGLIALTAIIGSLYYSQRVKDYELRVRRVRADLDAATIYAQVRPDVVVPPEPLSIFSHGVDKNAGQVVGVSIDFIGASMGRLGGSDNALMKSLVEIDFVTVVQLLLSFMAVVLGFDAICGERESGVLRQLLTNPVPRGTVVWAKLLGGVLSLCLPLAVAYCLALLIVNVNPSVHFSAAEWVRLGLLFAVTCLFLAQVYAMSLAVSSFTRSSATSLVICLFGWLVLNIGYGSVLPSISRYAVAEHTFQEFLDQLRAVRAERDADIEHWEVNNPPPEKPYLRAIEAGQRLRYGHPDGYEWRQRRNGYAIEQHLDAARRVHQYQVANYAPLAREVELVDTWSVLSPFTNYRTLAKQLARTTLAHKYRLRTAGHQYRDTYLDYLRGRDAFSSRRWFTDDAVDQEPMLPDPESLTPEDLAEGSLYLQARRDWVQREEARAETDSRRRLDLSDMPRFGGDWKEPLPETLRRMTPGLAVLMLTFGIAVLLTVTRFLRYDPR